MASSSSSSCIYEVFLNFRGEDTRAIFTCHLYVALFKRKKIRTFVDDEELRRGDEISPALLNAIQGSKISVVVFSKDYASSKWCLNELVKILDCKNMKGQIIIPVFYGVSPSDVRHQTGIFGLGFGKLEQQFKEQPEMVRKWRDALTESSHLAGHESTKFRSLSFLIHHFSVSVLTRFDSIAFAFLHLYIRDNAQLLDKIVEDVLKKLEKLTVSTDSSNGLVGLNSRIEQIKPFLCMDSSDTVQIVGIWGMGGIGKTTLATAIFDQFSSEFEGSRIVVTTRDKRVLEKFGVEKEKIYGVNGLEFEEAFELFCNFAFKENHCPKDLIWYSQRVVEYADGNPLVLKVLGSSLCLKRKSHWGKVLHDLNRICESDIHDIYKKLKISFDELTPRVQSIFLDIACFFEGEDKDFVARILDDSDCINLAEFPKISGNIKVLKLARTWIEEVPSSIKSLINLEVLDLAHCKRLNRLSASICKLKSLSWLRLYNCSKLESFPGILEDMARLEYIDLRLTAIKELPSSVEHLEGLKELRMEYCHKLGKLPDNLGSLRSGEPEVESICGEQINAPQQQRSSLFSHRIAKGGGLYAFLAPSDHASIQIQRRHMRLKVSLLASKNASMKTMQQAWQASSAEVAVMQTKCDNLEG
ncbi:hypothetical protein WN943_015956 [Citrus x changshan-huyou]